MIETIVARYTRHAKYLDQIYLDASDGPADARYFNADISEMNEARLRRELECLRLRLIQDFQPCAWLLNRYDALVERLEAYGE